jgi:alpha,alpha-trehalose phosphorylase
VRRRKPLLPPPPQPPGREPVHRRSMLQQLVDR